MSRDVEEDERVKRVIIAQSIWAVLNADTMPTNQAERRQAWASAKPEMVRQATKILRRLEKQGLAVIEKSD